MVDTLTTNRPICRYNFINHIILSTCSIATLNVYLLVNMIRDYVIDVECCDNVAL